MRLDTLHLQHLGHFRDLAVPLAGPPGAIRFVVGPNEAGKSTLRAGLRAALFGVTAKSLQGTPQRAVRLTLDYTSANADPGQIRRSGAREPRDANDQIIHPDDLAKLLGVTPELFDTLFCLGHHELREHGAALLQADGSIGAVLFGAALGGTAVHDAMRALDAHADRLYKPRGRNQRIPELLAALKDADAALDAVLVSAERWAELTDRHRSIESRLTDLRGRRAALAGQRRDTERLQAVGPLLVQRARLESALQQVAAEGPLATDAQVRAITTALDGRQRADLDLERLAADISRTRTKLDHTPAADDTLAHVAAIEQLAECRNELRRDLVDIERLTRRLDGAPQRGDLQFVCDVLADTAVTAAGMEALADLERRAGELHTDLHDRRRGLGLDHLEPVRILALQVPSEELLDEVRSTTERRAARRDHLHERATDLRQQRDATEARHAAVRAASSVPDLDEVLAARAHRDDAWRLAQGRLIGHPHPDDDPATPAPELAAQVTGGLAHADSLADAILTDTERMSELRAIRADLARITEELARTAAEVDDLDAADAEAHRRWTELWQSVGQVPASASEGVSWRARWAALCDCIVEHRRITAEIERRHSLVDRATEGLRSALTDVGETTAPDLGFAGLRSRAEAVVARADERRADEEHLAEAERRVGEIHEQLGPLRALLGPETVDRRPDEIIASLRERRDEQRANHQARQALLDRLDELDQERAAAVRARDSEQRQLDAVAADLRVPASQLDAVRDRSIHAATIRQQLDENAVLIVDAGGGLDLATLTERARQAGDDTELTTQLATIAAETEAIDTEVDQLNRQLGELAVTLAHTDGSDTALELEERRQELLAELAGAVEDYVEVTLAKGLLEQVVTDTGSGRHDHLLARAGHYLEVLTGGDFAGLEVETHRDEHHAVALRSDGSRLYPGQLSDGTLDQLWLALRLAGIEHHLAAVGPVPVVVDDVLVHFDDHRSAAALTALGELATSTQVVVLTHHPHLVELARARLGDQRVLVTELAPRGHDAPASVSVIGGAEARAPVPPRSPAPPTRPRVTLGSSEPGPRTGSGTSALDPERDELLGGLSTEQWRSKAEILDRCQITPNRWSPLIKALLVDGTVEQQGAKKGARYRLASPIGVLPLD